MMFKADYDRRKQEYENSCRLRDLRENQINNI